MLLSEEWPLDGILFSQNAEWSVLSASSSQYDCFSKLLAEALRDMMDIHAGRIPTDITVESLNSLTVFLCGDAGVEIIVSNENVEIELRRRQWGWTVMSVQFSAGTIIH